MHKVVQFCLKLVNARPLNHLNHVNDDEVETATGGKRAKEERDQKVVVTLSTSYYSFTIPFWVVILFLW